MKTVKSPRFTITTAERHIAASCIEFVTAGEWPFDDIRQSAAEALRDKLRGHQPLEREQPVATLAIEQGYLQCKRCLEEVMDISKRTDQPQSPETYARFNVGFTKVGLQVWCRRHAINVAHIDFEGIVHPANLAADLTNPQKC